jgi:DNA-binding LytR/AlgR family response regulator
MSAPPPARIRVLIAEDEPVLAQTLVQSLQRLWPEIEVVAMVQNGIAAVEEALARRPDVLFLDIKMPGKTGLEAAQELAEDWPENGQGGTPFPLVVFVTAYDEYALEAFEHAAIDYVMKPVNDARLAKTVERLKARLELHQERSGELDRIVGQLRAMVPSPAAPAERLTVIRAAVGNQIRLIPVDDVIYFEATDKYINVVTAEHESLIRTSLKELLPQLDPQQFWQIHRGTVVKVSRIQAAMRDDNGKMTVRLHGRNELLTVSRIYVHLFKQM